MAELIRAKQVTIVTEALILESVVKTISELGVAGYTVSTVTGKGEKGVRGGDDVLDLMFKNVKVEVIVDDEAIAKKIMIRISEQFTEHYAGIVYAQDVDVLSPERFSVGRPHGLSPTDPE